MHNYYMTFELALAWRNECEFKGHAIITCKGEPGNEASDVSGF